MHMLLVITQITTYFILLMLVGYLLNRSATQPLGVATAGALGAFALIQADQFLGVTFEGRATGLAQILWAAYPLPVALWARAAILLLPGENLALDRAWWTLILPITVLLILGGWIGGDLVDVVTRDPGPLYWTYTLYNIGTILVTLWAIHNTLRRTSPTDRAHQALYWLRLAGLAFGSAMVILMLGLLSPAVVFSLVVFDVLIFGLVGIAYDAIAEGQSVRRDLTYASIKTLVLVGLVILPWGIAIWAADAWSLTIAIALMISVGAVALIVPLQDELERLIDALLFSGERADAESRQTLRILLRNAARRPVDTPNLIALDSNEFTRLTRRALSHMPNLPRLAASPLTDLTIVTTRTGDDADTLQRAQELRRILVECIDALRPPDRGNFGTTDEWRFFNALYYPYVAGISPYRRSLVIEEFEDNAAEVIEWFRAMVPQRTMYNWQNRGAELIADILLEREHLHTA